MSTGSEAARSSGLEGVVVADTRLSDVDGEGGHLRIAGHDVEVIGGQMSFEALTAELWREAGEAIAASDLRDALGRARSTAYERLPALGDALAAADGMESLRATIAHLSAKPSSVETLIDLTAAVPVFAAAWDRKRRGLAPTPPDPKAGHAADYLAMLTGKPAAEPEARALDSYLVTVSDHGMNASTFAARVVASTGSDAVSAVVAAIGALKGPLHGGAPGPVLDMLDAIGSPERAPAWIAAELERGKRIMGIGHRVYRVRDPRAAVLESAAAVLEANGPKGRLALARAVERAAVEALAAKHPERRLQANVEFATAILLDAIGIDRRSFSTTFAVGRVAGWTAHIVEQRRTGRLIRPASRYIGR